jgi:hypothetical protein
MKAVVAATLLVSCAAASAQPTPARGAAPREAPPVVQTARPQSQPRQVPEPNVQRTVIEDEGARIEELRVRGELRSVIVKPKNGAAYEIVPPAGGRDPSQNRANQQPGAAGQRVWNLLRF